MAGTTPHATTAAHAAWPIAFAGAVALAVAMGIGRFAFTPILPMMLADGVIDLPSASWLASANYLGYLAGALLCTFQPLVWRRLRWRTTLNPSTVARVGLVATVVLTFGMAVPLASAWPWLRFSAGVASAGVFVFGSAWCLATLARLGVPSMAGFMFTGPGVGIAISGIAATGMVAWHWRAQAAWLLFGALAFVLTASVWRRIAMTEATPAAVSTGAASTATASAVVASTTIATPTMSNTPPPSSDSAATASHAEVGWLAFAYGLAGFGYIVTATFLPVIAREALPGSPWLDLFWPTFGVGIVIGALLSMRVGAHLDRRVLLAACYVMQAAAIGTSVWRPTLAGFAVSSLMLGLPFTAITFFAMQEVRRLRPQAAASLIGLLTAMYGIGQIVGPPMVAWLLHARGNRSEGFAISLTVAAASLFVGAAIYLGMSKAYPLRAPV